MPCPSPSLLNRRARPQIIRLLDLSDAYTQSLYPAESNHLVDLSTLEKSIASFFVARNAGEIVGCAALLEAGDGTAEIKRMFVDPEARGLKVASRLMERLEEHARALGLDAIRLETGIYQPEAVASLSQIRLCRRRTLRLVPAGPAQPLHGEAAEMISRRRARCTGARPARRS